MSSSDYKETIQIPVGCLLAIRTRGEVFLWFLPPVHRDQLYNRGYKLLTPRVLKLVQPLVDLQLSQHTHQGILALLQIDRVIVVNARWKVLKDAEGTGLLVLSLNGCGAEVGTNPATRVPAR